MKRPEGFDRPAARPSCRCGPRGVAGGAIGCPARGRTAADGGPDAASAGRAGAQASGADPDRVATEPIELGRLDDAGAGSPPRRPSAGAGRGARRRRPQAADGDRAERRLPPASRATPGRPSEPSPRPRASGDATNARRCGASRSARAAVASPGRWPGELVALVTVGVVAGAYSPLMALREVRVEGAQRIPAAEVVAAFDGELGTPLPHDRADAVHDALADFSLIETYSTETIPPGTLVVRIVERTPVGVIEAEAGCSSSTAPAS